MKIKYISYFLFILKIKYKHSITMDENFQLFWRNFFEISRIGDQRYKIGRRKTDGVKNRCVSLIFWRYIVFLPINWWNHEKSIDFINVLKTGPDRPVQPSTGLQSGPIHPIRPFRHWTNHKPPKPAVGLMNRWNRTVLNEPNGSNCPIILQA